MGSTHNGSKTMVSVCCLGISGVFILYKIYKYQQREPHGKKLKCTIEENLANKCMNFGDLPIDVVAEIFSYLSVEDFLNCTCVWKQLNVFRENRYFCKKFMMRKTPRYFCNYYFTSYDYDMKDRITDTLATCDGLSLKAQYIKIEGNVWKFELYIKNPATCERLMIPKPPNKIPRVDYAFAFVPSTGMYKVVSVYQEDNKKVKCAVLTIGADKDKWRDLEMPEISSDSVVVVQAGLVVHCLGKLEDAYELISFDLETECFTVTNIAKNFISKEKADSKQYAICWNDHLSFVYIERKQLSVLVLEDYKKLKWADKFVISLNFLEEKIYDDKEIVPLSAQNGLLWLKIAPFSQNEWWNAPLSTLGEWWKTGGYRVGFELETGEIAQKLTSKPIFSRYIENRRTNMVFSLVASLISIKGMQPRRKPRFHRITSSFSSVFSMFIFNLRYPFGCPTSWMRMQRYVADSDCVTSKGEDANELQWGITAP